MKSEMKILYAVAFFTSNLVTGNDVFQDTCKLKSAKLDTNLVVSLCLQDNPIRHQNVSCSVQEEMAISDFTVYVNGQSMKDCHKLNKSIDQSAYRASCLKIHNVQLTKNIVGTMARALSLRNNWAGFTGDIIGNLSQIVGGVALIGADIECHSKNVFIDMCGNNSMRESRAFLKFYTPLTKFEQMSCKCHIMTSSTVLVRAMDVRLTETLLFIYDRDYEKEWNGKDVYWKQDDPLFQTIMDFYIHLIMPVAFPENIWLLLEGDVMNISCVGSRLMINNHIHGPMVALIIIILVMFNLVPILFYIVISRYSVATRARDAVKRFSFLRKNSDLARNKSSNMSSYVIPQSGQYDEMSLSTSEPSDYISTLL